MEQWSAFVRRERALTCWVSWFYFRQDWRDHYEWLPDNATEAGW